MSAIFTSFSHTHHGTNALNLGLVKHSGTANSAWQVFAGKTAHDKFGLASVVKMVLVGETMGGSIANLARRQWSSACGRSGQSENGAVFGGGLLSLSLSLSLSLVARTFWHAFALNLQGFSHTHILKQKFNFFTQNSTHFINLTQISSHTQGFFIFLPQVFAQFLLINSLQRSSYGRQGTKAPF